MKDNGTSAGIEKKLVSRAMTPEELSRRKEQVHRIERTAR